MIYFYCLCLNAGFPWRSVSIMAPAFLFSTTLTPHTEQPFLGARSHRAIIECQWNYFLMLNDLQSYVGDVQPASHEILVTINERSLQIQDKFNMSLSVIVLGSISSQVFSQWSHRMTCNESVYMANKPSYHSRHLYVCVCVCVYVCCPQLFGHY